MIILAIESSCDETAVALVRDGREVLTDQVFSQADLHAIYGGVVPEIASRSHVEVISQLADRALAVTGLTRGDIDAVAVTCAPGLIGALLDALCARAAALDLAFLTLEVRASNAPAIALYRKHGFQTVGQRRNYYQKPDEDALLMTWFRREAETI